MGALVVGLKKTFYNLKVVVDDLFETECDVRFNEMDNQIYFKKKEDAKCKPITANDYIEIRCILSKKYSMEVAKVEIYDMVLAKALSNEFNPFAENLKQLSDWDKTPRLKDFFYDYCGVENRSTYIDELLPMMLKAIIFRNTKGATKFDYLPIFVGNQGIGKSRLATTLALKPNWFTDSQFNPRDTKQIVEQSCGKIIVEWAEITYFNSNNQDFIKSFLSSSSDRVRLSFRRDAEDFARKWIMIATTNRDRFLSDLTGNRRMLPIKMNKIDIVRAKQDMPQIWAEALHQIDSGDTKTYLSEEGYKSLREAHTKFIELPPFYEEVTEFLEIVKEGFTVQDIIDSSVVFTGIDSSLAKAGLKKCLLLLGYKCEVYYCKREKKSVRRYRKVSKPLI